jgi:endoglucanase
MRKLIAGILVSLSTVCFAAEDSNVFNINKMIGRGINIGAVFESPNEGDWGVTLQEEYFQLIKDAGFNSIRLPISWSTHAMDKAPYTIDANFFKRIDWAVKNTMSRQMAVIINTHHYKLLYADPNGQRERFAAIWRQIAEHYKDYSQSLIFELLNEPEGNLKAAEWNSISKEALAAVRQSNPHRAVIIGPVNWNDIKQLNSLELPEDDRNIIATAHYYLPFRFTHQGAPWASGAESWLGTKWTGSDAEKRAITKDFDEAAEWAKRNNRPFFIGEFGTYKKADMDSRIRWTKFVADEAVNHDFSLAYWEFCYNMGLYDRESKTWHKPLLDAVIPPKN